ncbi:MAG: PKD domain-containing protein [Gammaproteobacteria bacterium]|nr:PKD domain-containing protein [Gammaproteobacteria bacterium]
MRITENTLIYTHNNRMNNLLIKHLFITLLLMTSLSGCVDGDDESPGNGFSSNSPPVAVAGNDRIVATDQLVQLDGAASSDANNDPLTYRWLLTSSPSGSNSSLNNTTIINPTFTPDTDGTYVLQLVVNDGQIDSRIDTLTIISSTANIAPVAIAGPDQAIETSQIVQLDGAASNDANNDPLTYRWRLTSLPPGSDSSLSSTTVINPTFTPDTDGTYTLQLIVNDGQEDSSADTVIITSSTTNIAPIANAGSDQTVETSQTVLLDGSASSDANNDPLTYRWSLTGRPPGSGSSLNSTTVSNPTFTPDLNGSYVLQLIVNDGQVDSSADTVTITSSTANIAPIASAGPDQTVATGQAVMLDGIASSDANNDQLTYLWSLINAPDDSGSSLNNTTVSNPTFTPDLDGNYVLQLIVNDGQLDSSMDIVTIISSTANIIPIANAGPDQTIETNQTVQLDGSASSDANNDPLTYLWSLTASPPGSSSSLSSATIINPMFTPDVDGIYLLQLIVNDGQEDSSADMVTITSSTVNIAPVANAGPSQTAVTSQLVQLDGSASSDANNDPLTYSWSFTVLPDGSNASLDSMSIANPVFVPDMDGTYTLSLLVNDGALDSVVADTVTVVSSVVANAVADDFASAAEPLPLVGYTTNNGEEATGHGKVIASTILDVKKVNGRYRAFLQTNPGNITLHYHQEQGRLDARLATFPFDYIARNIGIGTSGNSQTPPPGTGNPFIFTGIQVHVPDLQSRNSSHIVVGHRGGSKYFTVEGKNTVNGVSQVNDAGLGVAPSGRADLRIVGNMNRTLTIYWQLPNETGNSSNDEWILYRGDGQLPVAQNTDQPVYGSSVYIGLITYAQGSQGLPFVGTADAIEFTP